MILPVSPSEPSEARKTANLAGTSTGVAPCPTHLVSSARAVVPVHRPQYSLHSGPKTHPKHLVESLARGRQHPRRGSSPPLRGPGRRRRPFPVRRGCEPLSRLSRPLGQIAG